jgi:hypothetical protein
MDSIVEALVRGMSFSPLGLHPGSRWALQISGAGARVRLSPAALHLAAQLSARLFALRSHVVGPESGVVRRGGRFFLADFHDGALRFSVAPGSKEISRNILPRLHTRPGLTSVPHSLSDYDIEHGGNKEPSSPFLDLRPRTVAATACKISVKAGG